MSNKKELLDRIRQLETLVESYEEPVKKEEHPLLWVPEIDKKYWAVTGRGYIPQYYHNDADDAEFIKRSKLFKTESEAIKADEQRIALLDVNRQVVRLTQEQFPEWVYDWNDRNCTKHYPIYNHDRQLVEFECDTDAQFQFTFKYAPEKVWQQIDTNLIKKAMGV